MLHKAIRWSTKMMLRERLIRRLTSAISAVGLQILGNSLVSDSSPRPQGTEVPCSTTVPLEVSHIVSPMARGRVVIPSVWANDHSDLVYSVDFWVTRVTYVNRVLTLTNVVTSLHNSGLAGATPTAKCRLCLPDVQKGGIYVTTKVSDLMFGHVTV